MNILYDKENEEITTVVGVIFWKVIKEENIEDYLNVFKISVKGLLETKILLYKVRGSEDS